MIPKDHQKKANMLFYADAYILDVIYSFLEDDEYALVNYQSLSRADPRKYERKSIFAAHAAKRLNDPVLRFWYSLSVDFDVLPKTILMSVYREEAFDVYMREGIYHPEMIDKILKVEDDVFRAAFPRGIKHYGACDNKISRRYISLLTHPIGLTRCVVDEADNGDMAIAEWFCKRYDIHDMVVTPKRYETYMIFKDVAMIDYSALDAEDIHRLVMNDHVYTSLSKRKDADTLELDWPKLPGVLRNAIVCGHVSIVKKILTSNKPMLTVAYQALSHSTMEVAMYVYDFGTPYPGTELCHEYFYKMAKKPITHDAAIKAIRTYGVSRDAYRNYLVDGGDVYISSHAETAHRYQWNFSRETMSGMCYHLLGMPIDMLKDIQKVYVTRRMPDTIYESFVARGII